jgi:NAD-reducing hydrogenase small subunit
MSDNNTGKLRVATVWLDGCSGCHMSFLDMDERLVVLAERIDLVYSPLVDTKVFPNAVDLTLVEGAVSSEEDLHKIKTIRHHTKYLVSLGDCAVTGNVPSMRNAFPVKQVLDRAYQETATLPTGAPWDKTGVPPLLTAVRPVHTVVKVDLFIPGCPPSADTIFFAVSELLEGRMPDLQARTRFGA